MSWYSKEQITHFDVTPIEGLIFLDGDRLARATHQTWSENQKYPMIVFPSGMEFAVWQADLPDQHRIHLFGKLELILEDTFEHAFRSLRAICDQVGGRVYRTGDHQLVILGHKAQEQLLVTYDPFVQRFVNVEKVPIADDQRWASLAPLMTDELREQLPPLDRDDEEEARVFIKYMIPDAPYLLFASAFDGEDLFWGVLLDTEQFEMRWAYFRLSELEQYASQSLLRLPVQREVSFTPQTLTQLIQAYIPQKPPQKAEGHTLFTDPTVLQPETIPDTSTYG